MSEEKKYLYIPGHVPIKEAASILDVSIDSIQRYIHQKRLIAEKIDGRYMVTEQSIEKFQSNPRGRVRTRPTNWRTYSTGTSVYVLQIEIQVLSGKREALQKKMSSIAHEQLHLFPGTMQRYILTDTDNPDALTIQFIWKNTELTDETVLQDAIDAFKSEFADLLDWQTARFVRKQAIIHT